MVKETPLVSIVCVAYNHEGTIRKALDGFLMQRTPFPIEVIVHDDASRDGTAAIVKEYAEKYPDVIVPVLQQENQYSKGRKPWLIMFPMVRGRYIAFCEGDDYWTDPLKLQKQVAVMEADENVALSFHQVLVKSRVDGRADRLTPAGELKTDYVTEDLIGPYFIHTSSIVFRQRHLQDMPLWMLKAMSGDIPLQLLLSLKGVFRRVDGVMSVWRQNNESVSAKHLDHYRFRGMVHMYEAFNWYTERRYDPLIQKVFLQELALIPEMKELKALHAERIPFSRKLYYFAWNHFPWSRRFLDRKK